MMDGMGKPVIDLGGGLLKTALGSWKAPHCSSCLLLLPVTTAAREETTRGRVNWERDEAPDDTVLRASRRWRASLRLIRREVPRGA